MEIGTIVWIIGVQFTIGLTLLAEDEMSTGEKIAAAIFCTIIWPLALGAAVSIMWKNK